MHPLDADFLTVNNVKDSGGFNTIAPGTKVFIGIYPPLQASGPQNMIVVEAEDFDFKASGAGGHNWVFNTALTGLGGSPAATGTFSGRGDMDSVPNSGASQGDNNLDTPRLDYCVNLPVTGAWFVWLRYVGPTGADDSVHVGIDGAESPFGFRMGNNASANRYEWNNFNNAGGAARFTNNTAGPHVFSIWMREDGTRVDKILLTTDASFNIPDITVLGPDATPRTAFSKLTIVKDQPIAGAATMTWPGAGWTLQGTPGLGNPQSTTVWQTLPYTSPVIIPPGYFGPGNTNVEFRLIAQ